jgi:hypothetical protein
MDAENLKKGNDLTKQIKEFTKQLENVEALRERAKGEDRDMGKVSIYGTEKRIDGDILEIALFIQEKRIFDKLAIVEKEFNAL